MDKRPEEQRWWRTASPAQVRRTKLCSAGSVHVDWNQLFQNHVCVGWRVRPSDSEPSAVVCAGPDVLLQTRCRLHRRVREKALVQAFTTVLLVLLGSSTTSQPVKTTNAESVHALVTMISLYRKWKSDGGAETDPGSVCTRTHRRTRPGTHTWTWTCTAVLCVVVLRSISNDLCVSGE